MGRLPTAQGLPSGVGRCLDAAHTPQSEAVRAGTSRENFLLSRIPGLAKQPFTHRHVSTAQRRRPGVPLLHARHPPRQDLAWAIGRVSAAGALVVRARGAAALTQRSELRGRFGPAEGRNGGGGACGWRGARRSRRLAAGKTLAGSPTRRAEPRSRRRLRVAAGRVRGAGARVAAPSGGRRESRRRGRAAVAAQSHSIGDRWRCKAAPGPPGGARRRAAPTGARGARPRAPSSGGNHRAGRCRSR